MLFNTNTPVSVDGGVFFLLSHGDMERDEEFMLRY